MEAKDLKKFIKDNYIECHYDDCGKYEVYFFVPFYLIEKFASLLTNFDFDDGGVECWMKERHLAFHASTILEPRGIELIDVFDTIDE